jgi:6,7-dimethyl-8-ribityllumazine synthase
LGRTFEGNLQGEGLRLAIVVSRFNDFVTQRLLEGARGALDRYGVGADEADVAYVPGSFELPLAARRLAESGRYHAIICLGAVIRGETPHFDYVANQVSSGIGRASYETGVPVIFGVITADTTQQALERAGGKMGNKGYDAAVSAIEMANLMRGLRPE